MVKLSYGGLPPQLHHKIQAKFFFKKNSEVQLQFPLKFDFYFYWVFIDENTQMSIIPALQVLTLWNHLGAPLLIESFNVGTKNTAGAHGLRKSQGEKTNKTNKQTTLISSRMSNKNWFDYLHNSHSLLSLSLSLSLPILRQQILVELVLIHSMKNNCNTQ